MATRKCGNIYFRKYFMAVRKFTNIFVLLLVLMVDSRDTLFLVCFTEKKSQVFGVRFEYLYRSKSEGSSGSLRS